MHNRTCHQHKDTLPVHDQHQSVSLAVRQIMLSELQVMHKARVICPSQSPYSSLIILVNKKVEGICFYVDYQKLNDVTKVDTYLVPWIDDSLDCLPGAVIFVTMDFMSGY